MTHEQKHEQLGCSAEILSDVFLEPIVHSLDTLEMSLAYAAAGDMMLQSMREFEEKIK
jgi:hypothetical protein